MTRGAWIAGAAGCLLLLLPPAPATAQRDGEVTEPRLLITGWGGFSLREGQSSFRFADDVLSFGGRLTLNRGTTLRPWAQVDRFTRPDLSCQEGLVCNEDGVLIRGGVTLPLSEEDTRPGVHPHLTAGVGWGISEDTGLTYLLGVGVAWAIHPRIAPLFELRWERIPGLLSFGMLGAGLRVGLF